MESKYVQAALSLLKKAGRMDLVRQEALPALRPARKAAQGVAAAVMACSPPRAGARLGQGELRGRGEPGERRAAQSPWPEELAEPRAAGRS
ncbi:hypothetical protein NDU88_006680 [Pleurodeles waltl]|uniref:Uncharacterized protein n=1 Tax=Pleurodeles waltl TaxID=8319 RepID=A0AAV7PJ22_PLEWA|nr:hypothetical protein NDU88_006680 [Pleurodeles waltl]